MKKALLILVPLIFFLSALATIGDYNVNWDEPEHFMRGQGYLRYMLTGQKNYDSLSGPRRSIYQSASLDASYFLEKDYGHPPLNDILAALSNSIFYQRLNWIGDIDAYHLFIILTSTLLVYLVGHWAAQEYGTLAGIVASGTLALSPLLIAESHNNIKDPVESTFYALTIYWFYLAIKNKRWQNLIASAIFAGLALGTKFNVIFLPFIILSWLILISLPAIAKRKVQEIIKLPKAFWIALLIYPVIAIAILYAGWPRLWGNPIEPLLKTINWYREIGTGLVSQPGYSLFGFNTYPTLWIFYTTPIITLLLLFLGIYRTLKSSKTGTYKPSLLWLLWFLIPIVRVSFPGASIYGGTRQIMEYLPAAALLAGLGAQQFGRIISKKVCITLLLIAFLPTILKLYSIHPNENLYFNALIGGLPGAVKQNLPGWGTTLGNPYLQGVNWINSHVEPNAKVALTLGVMTNIPFTAFRSDIEYSNTLKSVHWNEGEYVFGLTYSEFPVPFYDALYYERFLQPIHEIKVEGIPIVRIWKNNADQVKPGYLNEVVVANTTNIKTAERQVDLQLDSPVYLTKLDYFYLPQNCQRGEDARILTSLDGKVWKLEPETLLVDQIPRIQKKIDEGAITHFLAAVPAKFVRIETRAGSCLLHQPRLRLFGLRDVFP